MKRFVKAVISRLGLTKKGLKQAAGLQLMLPQQLLLTARMLKNITSDKEKITPDEVCWSVFDIDDNGKVCEQKIQAQRIGDKDQGAKSAGKYGGKFIISSGSHRDKHAMVKQFERLESLTGLEFGADGARTEVVRHDDGTVSLASVYHEKNCNYKGVSVDNALNISLDEAMGNRRENSKKRGLGSVNRLFGRNMMKLRPYFANFDKLGFISHQGLDRDVHPRNFRVIIDIPKGLSNDDQTLLGNMAETIKMEIHECCERGDYNISTVLQAFDVFRNIEREIMEKNNIRTADGQLFQALRLQRIDFSGGFNARDAKTDFKHGFHGPSNVGLMLRRLPTHHYSGEFAALYYAEMGGEYIRDPAYLRELQLFIDARGSDKTIKAMTSERLQRCLVIDTALGSTAARKSYMDDLERFGFDVKGLAFLEKYSLLDLREYYLEILNGLDELRLLEFKIILAENHDEDLNLAKTLKRVLKIKRRSLETDTQQNLLVKTVRQVGKRINRLLRNMKRLPGASISCDANEIEQVFITKANLDSILADEVEKPAKQIEIVKALFERLVQLQIDLNCPDKTDKKSILMAAARDLIVLRKKSGTSDFLTEFNKLLTPALQLILSVEFNAPTMAPVTQSFGSSCAVEQAATAQREHHIHPPRHRPGMMVH